MKTGWKLVRVARLRGTFEPADDPDLVRSVGQAARSVGMRRPPAVFTAESVPVPMVAGLLRPVLVLPRGFLQRVSPEQLQAVVLHETAHIAHGDLWVGLLQQLAAVLFWWCSALHVLNRRLSDLREDICDNYVLQIQGDGLKLAEVLVELAAAVRRLAQPRLLGVIGMLDSARGGLEGRIARLLQVEGNTMTRMNRTALLAVALFGILVGTVTLVVNVQAADKAPVAVADEKAPAPGTGGKPGIAVKSPAAFFIENTDKVVNLTEDQKQAITKIFEAREQQTKDFQAKNAEKIKVALAALTEAYKSKDKEAIAKASKVYQELYTPMQETWKKSQADLMKVLTPEQRTKLSEFQLTTSVKAVTTPITLTEEQMGRIRAVWKEVQEGELQKYSQVLMEVLTVEQKTAIAKYRLMDAVKGGFRRANLTADQLKAIEATCDELLKGYFKLGLEPGLWGKVAEKVNGLLTAEQKEALKKTR